MIPRFSGPRSINNAFLEDGYQTETTIASHIEAKGSERPSKRLFLQTTIFPDRVDVKIMLTVGTQAPQQIETMQEAFEIYNSIP